jgi:hypothetical protein
MQPDLKEVVDRLLGSLEDQIYDHVAETVDFFRLFEVEMELALELGRLVDEGSLAPPPGDRDAQLTNLASMLIARVMRKLPDDPKRSAPYGSEEECVCCRMYEEAERRAGTARKAAAGGHS